ncbi:hypothetical protein JW926_07940 [Candidatus Sumerlaeota bacterium]|nr:hypothetical protein [Candidatus Sumerlaeota bacterium]
MKNSVILILILCLVFLLGCNTPSAQRITEDKFPPKPPDADVEMFVGTISQDHIPIAILNSRRYPDQSEENKVLMLASLKDMARKLGADAVMEIRILPKRFEGMVVDEKPPFPAWKPGNYYGYFMRGKAIVYRDKKSQ